MRYRRMKKQARRQNERKGSTGEGSGPNSPLHPLSTQGININNNNNHGNTELGMDLAMKNPASPDDLPRTHANGKIFSDLAILI